MPLEPMYEGDTVDPRPVRLCECPCRRNRRAIFGCGRRTRGDRYCDQCWKQHTTLIANRSAKRTSTVPKRKATRYY